MTSIYKSFSRRPRKVPERPTFTPFAEVSVAIPVALVAERSLSHRTLALEQTRATIDHYLELTRRWAEIEQRARDHQHAVGLVDSIRRNQIAAEEDRAWERWGVVIRAALETAEAEVVAVVRTWDATRDRRDSSEHSGRGVIHKGRLYLAVPADEDDTYQLAIVDLRASTHLDGSVAVADLARTFGPKFY